MAEPLVVVDCELCAAVDGRPLSRGVINANEVLVENKHFVIIPALGPLIRGHILVVTRTHSEGLLYCSDDVVRSYEDLVANLRAHCALVGHDLLEVEHGGGRAEGRRPCITHTHVHLFPGLGRHAMAFDSHLPRIAREYIVDSAGYISTSVGGEKIYYDAEAAVGQEIRRVVGSVLRVANWDWASNPAWSLIEQTVKYWRL